MAIANKYDHNRIIETIYNQIVGNKGKYAKFHKCLFHLHTPASHDYAVLEEYRNAKEDEIKKTVSQFTEEELFSLCVEKMVFSKNETLDILKGNDFNIFTNNQESMVYLLIANELCKQKIELVLITDHNTIDGFEKLQQAIKLIDRAKIPSIYPVVVLGIEISCADKNHVVGIFKETMQDSINSWLKEKMLSKKDGTYCTSLETIKWITKIGGIPYIAHINTSDMLSSSNSSLSGVYKKKLFSLPYFEVVGINHASKQTDVSKKIKEYSNREFCYVLDSDSHSIDTIEKNTFWIKGTKCSFEMIKDAVRDYTISIEYNKPEKPQTYIKGILLRSDEKAFLSGKENDLTDFCLDFSEALNCFIGGRGTGKSTILNILESVLCQRFSNEEWLNAFCEYPEIWLLVIYQDKDYLVNFMPPEKENKTEDSYIMYFDEKRRGHIQFNDIKRDLPTYALKEYINIYEMDSSDNQIKSREISALSQKRKLLNHFLDRGYSVNELVQTASSDSIHQYIIDTMKLDEKLNKPENRLTTKSGLIRFLESIEKKLIERNNVVGKEINPFNYKQQGKLKIKYEQISNSQFIDFKNLLEYGVDDKKNKYYKQYNISIDGVSDFLYSVAAQSGKNGICNLILWLLKGEYAKILEKCSPLDFTGEFGSREIDKGIIKLTGENINLFLNYIEVELESPGTLNKIINSFKRYISETEVFSLEFNITNKEDSLEKKPDYKNVKSISMGQKVVAMLSFILGYSDFSHDYRPLIIDQPEDNLDNRYIYKNLINDLRDIKIKRQIIIATHNATIVTNAKADQVVVLESDDGHGWIRGKGYPNEPNIKKHIVNYLEGGIDSFKHKCFIYRKVLNEDKDISFVYDYAGNSNKTLDFAAIMKILETFKANLSELVCSEEIYLEIEADIITIESQIKSPNPKIYFIRDALTSIRSLLENTANQMGINQFLKQLRTIIK